MTWQSVGKVLVALFLVVLIAGSVAVWIIIRHGLSARQQPTAIEETFARGVRHLAMPASMRKLRNSIAPTDDVLADGRAHWADHCATCHANDGSGETEIGRNLYPKAPDMRQPRTQNLTDGELFAIIKNGIRLTGMPAWGDPSGRDDADTWKLVHFIRHLPKITPAEVQQMKGMNPISPMELKEKEEEEKFLKGM
jgi:mono/diheme cytochrome c family protein